ncbi:hypothetical protein EZV62_003707 [Acer yangbiense]|uniref:F-box domain-containing protein n=1 Tax=Acer yangbiense TaxID=1000413 RepID=A0A5C7IJD9_9ROSI|nr:hypothetical protein EZV62_003707 [Acer yangbiense]
MLSYLLAGCSLIEQMGIWHCKGIESAEFGLDNIMITNNKELKRVDMKKLNVSSFLSIVWPLTTPFEINVMFCNLKSLRFDGAYMTDEWLCKLVYELLLLECLELHNCDKLKSTKISSPSLKEAKFYIMKKTEIQKVDRISELPEPILHHILSFLHFDEVARTCVLSKKWERVWLTHPVVEIYNWLFNSCYHYEEKVFRRRRLKLLDAIEKCLRNRRRHCKGLVSMKKFTIVMKLLKDQEFAPFVDRCVSYAIGCNVKKLRLEFELYYDDYDYDDDDDDEVDRDIRYYNLPPIVFCAKSIEVLKLESCKVRLPIGSDVKLSNLRKLILYGVDINNHAINNLFAGCPLIEEVLIGYCTGFESLELFCLSRINNIEMFYNMDFSWVDVKLLNVSSLSILEDKFIQYDINVTGCSNLKDIELMGASMKDESLYKLISELPLLENLCLDSCPKLKTIKISSPSLKTLKIYRCYEVVELKIDSPNLSHFTYVGGMISLCSNALALSNIDLCFNLKRFENQSQQYVKLVELLTQFHSFSEALKLQVAKDEDFNVPKELRQILPSPSSSGKHFKLLINKISLPVSVAKVVVDLLSIAHHTKTISIEYLNSSSWRKISFEFSYKKPVGEASSCFKSHPISCWQHCLEEVKLESAVYDGIGIKRCSFKGAEFLERFRRIGSCDCLESVKISCTTLKTLRISECSKLVELKIDTPNLSVLHYWGDMISFSSNAFALSDIDIELIPNKFDAECCGTILNESDQQTHSYSLEGADILEKIDACCAIARSDIMTRFRQFVIGSFDIMEKTIIDEVDRISELPEPILHHIFSFLPFKQVVRIYELSKKWEETWRTYPVFKIDESILCQDERAGTVSRKKE